MTNLFQVNNTAFHKTLKERTMCQIDLKEICIRETLNLSTCVNRSTNTKTNQNYVHIYIYIFFLSFLYMSCVMCQASLNHYALGPEVFSKPGCGIFKHGQTDRQKDITTCNHNDMYILDFELFYFCIFGFVILVIINFERRR